MEGWDIRMCYLLFPAVESMDITPSGRRVKPFVTFADEHRTFISVAVTLLNCIPDFIKRWLVKAIESVRTPKCVVDAVLELLGSGVVLNIAYMARDELNVVRIRVRMELV